MNELTSRRINVLTALQRCRERATGYLQSQVYVTELGHAWRHSPTHNPRSHPDHLLYGTWAGALASVLLGVDRVFDDETRQRIGAALFAFQQPDGSFVMDRVPESARGGHNREYFTFHCTNYALGAARALGLPLRYPLIFVEAFATADQLRKWLSKRDWTQPWREGNNIVNLASFYAMLAETGRPWAGERLEALADWHDAHQNPTTGFWHAGDGRGTHLLKALAGGAHNLHIYHSLGRPIPRAQRIVDSCLRLGYLGVGSACVDIDVVDILSHLRPLGHRVREIDSVLERYLLELLPLQNVDGGFGDNYVTPQTTYGLVTPTGVSTTWTTYFRLATLGMITCTLFPDQCDRWTFRNTLGMGYFHPGLLGGPTGRAVPVAGPQLSLSLQRWLTARRGLRFARHRLTYRVRGWLATKALLWR